MQLQRTTADPAQLAAQISPVLLSVTRVHKLLAAAVKLLSAIPCRWSCYGHSFVRPSLAMAGASVPFLWAAGDEASHRLSKMRDSRPSAASAASASPADQRARARATKILPTFVQHLPQQSVTPYRQGWIACQGLRLTGSAIACASVQSKRNVA